MGIKLKVCVDDAPLKGGHAIRGMGFYAKNLINYLSNNHEITLCSDKCDIFHLPYFDLFTNSLKLKQGVKTVVTVPDVIPLLYPKIYKPGIKGKINFLKQKRALKNVDAVITISETSKKDIVRFLDVPADKIYVTYLGPGNPQKVTKKKMNLPKQYVLYVGDINWNKNIINLIKAINKIKTNLVIVGKQARELKDRPETFDFNHPEIKHFDELSKLLQSDNIRVLGYLESDEFSAVWQQATVYCQPSFYEGFGLPLLEAMQAGVPIVAAKTQALVEVAASAAEYFDPKSVEDMSEKINGVLKNSRLQNELIQKGVDRVKEFDWTNTAAKTVEVYKKIL